MPKKPPSIHNRIAANERSRRKTMAERIRSSSPWKTHRDAMKNTYPWCVACVLKEPNCQPKAATEVHHIKPIMLSPAAALLASNTPPLCEECHRDFTTMERNGKLGDAQAFFENWIERLKEVGYGDAR